MSTTPPPVVIRFVVTHVGKDGYRTYAHARQGRCTYATREEAQAWIGAAHTNNSQDQLNSLFGLPLEVRAAECYPGHFDPIRILEEA